MECFLEWGVESYFETIINMIFHSIVQRLVSFKWLVVTMLFAFVFVHVDAQNNTNKDYSSQADSFLKLSLESVGMTGDGSYAPFWHTSNRQGLSSIKNNNGYLHFAALGDASFNHDFKVGYGLDLGVGAGLESDIFVHQLYCDLDYKWLGLSMGMKERWNDKNRYLSSGALTWSGNCRPIPEIRAGIPDYVRMPFFGRWFSVKGHIGYGRLTDDRWRRQHGNGAYTEGILFHSKSAFLRWGDEERFPLQATLGLEMNNIFGGTRYVDGVGNEFPSDAAMYWTVLFPFHQVGKQGNVDGDNLGSWHINLDYKLKDWHIGTYYEHFYEDHSSMLGIEYKSNAQGKKDFIFFGFRHNWFDGLFGVEINAPEGIPFFRNAVLEFLNTRGQCGPILNSADQYNPTIPVVEEVDGRDGMYNHGAYDSYAHWGYAMGSPVLISPAYNNDGYAGFRSNRVRMFHFGIDGGITSCLDYRLLATTTKHWGCYGAPLDEVERVTSVMLECSYRLGTDYDWKFTLSGAMDFDSGDLLGNNRGVMLTVSRSWNLL